eukprot:gene607-656_t
MGYLEVVLGLLPLIPGCACLVFIQDKWSQLAIVSAMIISVVGYLITSWLIPVFAEYTLRRGIAGKDLGKKGTVDENKSIPEALGVVTGIVYLVCTILSQLFFAENLSQKVAFNSALFSVCFMILLGFMDDVLDLKWRYKLILPTVASMPLLMTYTGSTAMHLPRTLASFFMSQGELTPFGQVVNIFATVDTKSQGEIIELGGLFMVFMGLQAVFCTNSINILAGINGVEAGQAYIIGASVFFFKMFDIARQKTAAGENELLAIFLILPFIGVCLGLLKYNWYPSSVFVGDTFCYFAGMTFAVVGIHGHFSKTLLLLFIPQIINFLYSLPQLFKLVECPRHRLPTFDAKTGLLNCSTFPCRADQFKLLKLKFDDERCPNMTILNLILRICGPMHEKTLCVVFLSIQIVFSVLAVYIRYNILED